ncbi:bifunctional glycosyltransferase/CDP-glycerol:glycerophosphate glycerophosphotransferase [Kitasatospora atroaurantiaca]|uniref:bifunctional glycosyltransferase/CDP-glycerol:glycerophosphate glycerophosphotransferase n=1 Tax=Kitasatospora atroaurantiaca TaxID=285545 RepID=UPI0011A84C22|nr:bifunctional glycosyltransferase family 2 protein/CDP-glycerol:glycerophosphate glycerophosphotransferase [Kitasatospora atroaurantiaca]
MDGPGPPRKSRIQLAPRLSIVVPFQDVEMYLEACLKSLALQTFADFEVILVDDGSTDDSTTIAYTFAAQDDRFRVITQQSYGPGHARNTGLAAMHPQGEFLAFADGDDIVPPHAYELLISTLEKSGSDFVSGNVQMMNSTTTWQSPLHRAPMKKAKTRTHITKHRDLLYDRTSWNKVFRRSFWDHEQITFPEGVLYEDSWVNLVAHFRAKSVDVVNECVYYWRRRDAGAGPSITQRHTEIPCLIDRVSAVESVSHFLGRHRAAAYQTYKRWYDESALKSDLMIHLNVLPDADEEFREVFLQRTNDFLDTVDQDLIETLPTVDRLKWTLVRKRLMPELLAVLEHQRKRAPLPVVRRVHRYAALPGYKDRDVPVPRKTYRLSSELALSTGLDEVIWEDDGHLRVAGHAYIRNLNVHKRRMSLKAVALRERRTGRWVIRPARTTHHPQATENSGQGRYCYDWSGYEFNLDPEALKKNGKWVEGTWDIAIGTFSRGLFRKRSIVGGPSGTASHPPARYVAKNTRVLPIIIDGALKLRVEVVRARITGHDLVGPNIVLKGVLLAALPEKPGRMKIRSMRTGGEHLYRVVFFDAGGAQDGWCAFRVSVPLSDLVPSDVGHVVDDSLANQLMGNNGWKVSLHIPGRKRPLYPVVQEDVPDGRYPMPGHLSGDNETREAVVHRNGNGYLVFFERAVLPVVTGHSWEPDGALTLRGEYPSGGEVQNAELVVRYRKHQDERSFPAMVAHGTFYSVIHPHAPQSLAGQVPLASGTWDLFLRFGGPDGERLPVKADRPVVLGLPAPTEIQGRKYVLENHSYDRLTLKVHSAMPEDARGPYRQRLLRTRTYPAARKQPVRDAVLFDSFKGTQFSDSPRAVYQEVLRRRLGMELLWVVRDDQVELPPGVTPVRLWSADWYEALGRAKWIIANNHLPDWFERRDGQTVVQTWHGTPLKRIGHDIETIHFADQQYMDRLAKEVPQWSMLVSPNSFSTPILKRAFGFENEMLEIGYPRNDLLYSRDAGAIAEGVRRRIGLPPGKRVVLYAPTWRDDQFYAAGRYRLDLRIDLERARAELGQDHVLLIRRHPSVVDTVPGAGDGFVWDVSEYPDFAELQLITDVLITDYSSLMFDFANTGRPILFFTYDLEHYRDKLRGFYFDFEAHAPGPLISDSDQLIAAVRDADEIRTWYQERYTRFRQAFCTWDDGHASARLVDRLLGIEPQQHQALPPQQQQRPARTAPLPPHRVLEYSEQYQGSGFSA